MALASIMMFACSPDDETYVDNTDMDVSVIDHISLMPNQKTVLADGHAQIELYPALYNEDGDQIPDSRVKDEWLEYVSETSGVTVSRYFSTSDASLVGKTISAKLRIKGTNIESETVSFTVSDPEKSEYSLQITIPVIFHVIQTKEEVEYYGGEYKEERIDMQFKRLNNMLSAAVSTNPVGVNSNIQLVLATYDPNGKKLVEPGINRETVEEIFNDSYTDMNTYIASRSNVMWPEDKYLNIWLVSDRGGKIVDFANTITTLCAPHYAFSTATDLLEGLTWDEYTDATELKPTDIGIIYKLQKLDETERDFYVQTSSGKDDGYYMPGYNDLGHYLGMYLGLIPTCNYPQVGTTDDYCDDTMNYTPDAGTSWYKTLDNCYFRAENIMDDPTGMHCSVSRDQVKRMRWTLSNCPGRQAWKSTYATTGK